jgi:hypothetical protein
MVGAEGDNRLHGFKGDAGERPFPADARPAMIGIDTALVAEIRAAHAAFRCEDVTSYEEQWRKLLDMSDQIRAFIAANETQLKAKD